MTTVPTHQSPYLLASALLKPWTGRCLGPGVVPIATSTSNASPPMIKTRHTLTWCTQPWLRQGQWLHSSGSI